MNRLLGIEEIRLLTFQSNRNIVDPVIEQIIMTESDANYEHPRVYAHYYRFFYYLSFIMEPMNIVELGTDKGISAMCLAGSSPDIKVHTVDINLRVPMKNRFDNINYHIHDSLIPLEVNNIDILFIDTDHDGIRCEKEYELYYPKL